jgi:hypothetical protein
MTQPNEDSSTGAEDQPQPEPEHAERSRFARFAKKLVRVPKREIDEKGEEWKRDRERGLHRGRVRGARGSCRASSTGWSPLWS